MKRLLSWAMQAFGESRKQLVGAKAEADMSEKGWGELPGCSAGFILVSDVRVSWKGNY